MGLQPSVMQFPAMKAGYVQPGNFAEASQVTAQSVPDKIGLSVAPGRKVKRRGARMGFTRPRIRTKDGVLYEKPFGHSGEVSDTTGASDSCYSDSGESSEGYGHCESDQSWLVAGSSDGRTKGFAGHPPQGQAKSSSSKQPVLSIPVPRQVRALECQSIWDIPTARIPDPQMATPVVPPRRFQLPVNKVARPIQAVKTGAIKLTSFGGGRFVGKVPTKRFRLACLIVTMLIIVA